MKAVGIVLAAGASQRMGTPKALLCGSDGIPLAVKQAAVLSRGGCSPVALVLGARAEAVGQELPDDLTVVENSRWEEGRTTSMQAAVAALPETDGWLFMPVDAVGVQVSTIRSICQGIARDPTLVWRPVHQGQKGNLLWIPRNAGGELMRLPPDARVDEWVRSLANEIEVADPVVLRNVNTPEEWAACLREASGE